MVRQARGGRQVAYTRPVRLASPVTSGAITVPCLNLLQPDKSTLAVPSRVTLQKLWYKNADVLKRKRGSKKPPMPNPVISKAYAAIEADRQLCAIPERDKPRSRNDGRHYQWQRLGT